MSKIQERLNALRPYVIGIRYLEGLQLVDAVLKEGWTVPPSQIVQMAKDDSNENYYMFYSEDDSVDIDDLLDFVQEIININIEREKKYELLKVKVAELQKIFKDNSLSKLQKLKFSFNEPDIVPSLLDMDKIDDETIANNLIEETKVKEPKKVETTDLDDEQLNRNQKPVKNTNRVKTQSHNEVELPPKPGEKIELEDFSEPTNVVCKCGPDEICPICEDQKDFAY